MFAMGEWRRVLAYLDTASPGAFYLNPAQSDLLASDKLHQLDVANAVGLVFPDTICTNNPNAVAEFAAAQAGGRCIHKSLGPYMAPGGRVKFATLLDADRVSGLAGEIAACPSLYQQFIASDCEFRVTVVGGELFAVRVLKPDSAIVDWRRSSLGNRFEAMTLDLELEAAILRMQNDLGLVYGAYDFIRGTDGTDYFLEVNPMGQWLWLEVATELPISRAIANVLEAHGK
jgi:glutathione synthase/RimK-type ligase-like ATP-grasp enzyme